MIVVCKQKECEYNKNGRCEQKVLIIENGTSRRTMGLGFNQAVCKYWYLDRSDYITKHLGARPEEFDPRDEIIIEEGRPAQ